MNVSKQGVLVRWRVALCAVTPLEDVAEEGAHLQDGEDVLAF